jgi:drug/metabolite transporter (DMT)-like permease
MGARQDHIPRHPAELGRPPKTRRPSLFNNAYLFLAIAPLCWAGNHILGRAIAGQVPPGGLAVLRWLLAACILLPFALPHLRRDWQALSEKPWTIVLLAMAGGGLFGTLQFIALQSTAALNAAMLNSTVPAFIVVAAGVIFRDAVRPLQVTGIVVSLAGVIGIIGKGDLTTLQQLSFNGGDLLLVANMALFAVYSACLRLRPPLHWMTFMIALSVVSAIGNVPLAAWEFIDGEPLQTTGLTLFAVVYAGMCTSVIAYACWSRGVELIGAARAGVFLHLVPLYGALLSTLLLGEAIRPYHIFGLAFILIGVSLASRK